MNLKLKEDTYEGLTIHKEGLVTNRVWVYDEEKEEGSYVSTPIYDGTEIGRMMDQCRLADDVTLRDVLLVLDKNLDIWDCVIRNWCKELVNEGLRGEKVKYDGNIDYLELYWSFEISMYEGIKSFCGHQFPNFHGYGTLDDPSCEPGTKGNIGVSFSPVNELVNIPLKLELEVHITENNLDVKWNTIEELDKLQMKPIEIHECNYTLLHILYGIIWELSFHGGPTSRGEQKDKLFGAMKEVIGKIDGER